jgi:hypothetical protein
VSTQPSRAAEDRAEHGGTPAGKPEPESPVAGESAVGPSRSEPGQLGLGQPEMQQVKPGMPEQHADAAGQPRAPEGHGSAPQGQGSGPQGQGSAPQGQGSGPQGQGSAPQGQASAPQGQASAPEGRGSAPQGQASARPGQTGPMSQAQPPGQFGSLGQPLPPGQSLSPGAKAPWKAVADGKTVFRLSTQFVIWWAWIAFAIFNVFELVIRDRDYFSIEVMAALLAITGLAYACALRPKVVADDEAVVVYNPFRDHKVPWGAVNGVFLGDSVELSCARQAPKKDKTIYCWALYSGRRRRMRAQMQRSFFSMRRPDPRAPEQVRELSRLSIVQIMAAELARRANVAKEQGAPSAVLQSRWNWLALAALLLPSAALLGLALAH